MIHSILILRKTGELLYSRTFGTTVSWNDTLASGLISAIFHFTHELLGSSIEEFEIKSYKIVFEIHDITDLLFVAFFDKYDSTVGVREKLIKLKDIVVSEYWNLLEKELCCEEDFEGLDEIVDVVISASPKTDPLEKIIPKYTSILEEFRTNSGIIDCDLISISIGRPLTHKWKKDFLDLCLRQIDAFYKSTKNLALEQITLSYKGRHLFLYKVNDDLILSTIVRRETPLGLSTLLVEKCAEKIRQII